MSRFSWRHERRDAGICFYNYVAQRSVRFSSIWFECFWFGTVRFGQWYWWWWRGWWWGWYWWWWWQSGYWRWWLRWRLTELDAEQVIVSASLSMQELSPSASLDKWAVAVFCFDCLFRCCGIFKGVGSVFIAAGGEGQDTFLRQNSQTQPLPAKYPQQSSPLPPFVFEYN